MFPIIGLEVHLELKTKSKMFCGCSATHFHVAPNSHTCPVCLGLPGALPVPNQKALDYCLKIGLALGCTVQKHSFFERKNYFYPDLAKGFQISQYQQPLTVKGKFNSVRINRVHLEEDTAKSVHQDGFTLIDFNRSGVPLVEIVSEPDIKSAKEAKLYLLDLQLLIRYLGVSDADIEKGSLRCEPTVNVKINGKPTALVEIKNIASLSAVEAAINYEIDRQSENPDFSSSKTTRGWDADKQRTFLQRNKEGSSDYRYFPEPDIPPLEFTDSQIKAIASTIPELPAAKLNRYQRQYGLSAYDGELLTADLLTAQTYEAIVDFIAKKYKNTADFAKFTANLFNGPVKEYLNQKQKNIRVLKLGPAYFWELFQAVFKKQISPTVAKQLIVTAYLAKTSPLQIAKKNGLLQLSDQKEIAAIVKKVIADNPKAVGDYRQNPNSIGFLVGQVMQASGGSANPQLAGKLLRKLLN